LATLPPVVIDNEDGSSIILRYSAGVACSDEPGITTIDDWLRLADTHMYQHKLNFHGARSS
jgi:GGDEF domain-containing protein